MAQQPVEVAVGVVRNTRDQVLIALRPPHKHQGDLWEFPGGKIEPGESSESALARELEEELGIIPVQSRPLVKIPFDYGDKTVILHVREVLEFRGSPYSREGQPLRWVPRGDLGEYAFPLANQRIIRLLQLPELVAITGEFVSEDQFEAGLSRAVARGAGLIQIRLPATWANPEALLWRLGNLGKIPITVNSAVDQRLWSELPGLHLRAGDLMSLSSRPIDEDRWLGASCHNQEELAQAARLQVDYAFLSPVLQPMSHPAGQTLGWDGFARLMRCAELPIYALGGLALGDLDTARAHGARGIAGISAFWH